MTLDRGAEVGPYRIVGLVGAGGMGQVYRAHDGRLGRDVALKLMVADATGDATRLRRMAQEARAVAQLSHPNVIAVFDVGTHEGRMYLVTELLEGEPLRELIARGPVPWRTALGHLVQVAEGLAAAHGQGIVHRDIKPENVFLGRDGRVKILDFGVATWRTQGVDGLASATAATMSQAGLLVGTVGYMSPEQARGQGVDARSDVFAFGCLMHELLSGRRAFDGASPMDVLVAIQRDPPPSLLDLVPAVPPELVRVVDRCLEKDPGARFQSTRDLLFALTLIQTGGGSGRALAPPSPPGVVVPEAPAPPPVAPASVPRRRALLAGLSVLGAAAAAAIGRASARPTEAPSFRQISFRRGTVYTARFTPDGANVIYSAAWEGGPRELYITVAGTRDPRDLGQREADIASVLSSGELIVIRRGAAGFSPGVLSRLSLAGGPPRDLVEGVTWADTSADGAEVAAVRPAGEATVLELPAGKVLYRGAGVVYPRISPDGRRVAFLDIAEGTDDAGRLLVVDREGRVLLRTPVWKSIEGLAWRSDDEIWFTASQEGRSLALHAVDLRGRTRLVFRAPGRLVLHDATRAGTVVAERNSYRASVIVGAGDAERDLSWQDFAQLGQLSQDGKSVLFSELGDAAGSDAVAYLRPLDGAPPLRLGAGFALALSPDARSALVRVDGGSPHLEVVPVGAGRAQALPPGPIRAFAAAAFLPGAARIAVVGRAEGQGNRLYVQELGGGDPRPFGDLGEVGQELAASPDGAVVAVRLRGKTALVPLDGGPPRELPELGGHVPVAWSSDGRALFARRGRLAAELVRFEPATAKIQPLRTFQSVDRAGVLAVGKVSVARDGDVYAYESYRLLSDLYVIDDLR